MHIQIVVHVSGPFKEMLELKLFILLVVANGAPIIARKLLGDLYACPLDGGWRFPDKRSLFGSSKTVRGIVAALVTTIAVGLLLGIPIFISVTIAFFAMAGDLLSSFIKRRIGKPEGAMFIGLDQIPESLLPLLAIMEQLDLQVMQIGILVVAFIIFDLVMSRILYLMHIRKNPH